MENATFPGEGLIEIRQMLSGNAAGKQRQVLKLKDLYVYGHGQGDRLHMRSRGLTKEKKMELKAENISVD